MTTWSISEAAAKCGLSQHTLRWYERIGLLGPIDRTADGRRRFTEGDLDWLALITKLRETGMPVKDMQRYAELVRSGAGQEERLELLRAHRVAVRRALATQRECLKILDYKIGSYSRHVCEAQRQESQESQER
ncbi:MAG: MerR family transcriptional regulator [Streptosporangiaceae bacterium]|nr:MerR family transcriptional regulator [Streptosporangiaceae bacterium]